MSVDYRKEAERFYRRLWIDNGTQTEATIIDALAHEFEEFEQYGREGALLNSPRAPVTDERLREIVRECGFDGVVCLPDEYALDVARAVRDACEGKP